MQLPRIHVVTGIAVLALVFVLSSHLTAYILKTYEYPVVASVPICVPGCTHGKGEPATMLDPLVLVAPPETTELLGFTRMQIYFPASTSVVPDTWEISVRQPAVWFRANRSKVNYVPHTVRYYGSPSIEVEYPSASTITVSASVMVRGCAIRRTTVEQTLVVPAPATK